MKATVCDRCNATFTDNPKRGERKYILRRISNCTANKNMSRGSEIDLCPNCYNDLLKWIDEECN